MNRFIIGLLLTATVSMLTGCSTTKIVVSWQDSTSPAHTLKKPLIIAIVPNRLVRAKLEDEFISKLRPLGITAVASYSIFPEMESITPAAVKEKLPSLGCDAILVTYLVDVKQETVQVPARADVYGGPAYYRSFDSYYATSYGVVMTPAYSYVDKYYKLETNIYSVAEGKLIWTAATRTEDTSSIDKAISDFTGVIITDLRKGQIF
jgi:hypothetical protein